jgi:hypothetical protein
LCECLGDNWPPNAGIEACDLELQTLCRGTCARVVRAYNLPKIIITRHEEFGLPFECAGRDVDLVGTPLKPYFKNLI